MDKALDVLVHAASLIDLACVNSVVVASLKKGEKICVYVPRNVTLQIGGAEEVVNFFKTSWIGKYTGDGFEGYPVLNLGDGEYLALSSNKFVVTYDGKLEEA